MVDLDEPRAEARVEEDVEAEHLEAARVRAADARALAPRRRPVHAREVRLRGDEGLVDHVFDAAKHEPARVAVRVEPALEPRQRPLAARVAALNAPSVEDEVGGLFLDGVVGEVRRHVGHVALRRSGVGRRGKARQPVVEEPDAQRLDARDQDVDAEVEFEAVDEEGLPNVALRDARDALVHL